MIEQFFEDHWWPGPLLWIVALTSDYITTIVTARLYRIKAKEHLVFEGSFELTPQFQKDIDSLRWVSPRLLIMLVCSCPVLIAAWWFSHQAPFWPDLYILVLGALLLLEAAVHMRHYRNLFLFRNAFGPAGVTGRIEYPRKIILRISSFEFLEFAVLYFLVFVATQSWFLLGGALMCLGVANKHRILARRHKTASAGRQSVESAAPGAKSAEKTQFHGDGMDCEAQ
jgi:hypothetical protein